MTKKTFTENNENQYSFPYHKHYNLRYLAPKSMSFKARWQDVEELFMQKQYIIFRMLQKDDDLKKSFQHWLENILQMTSSVVDNFANKR